MELIANVRYGHKSLLTLIYLSRNTIINEQITLFYNKNLGSYTILKIQNLDWNCPNHLLKIKTKDK